MPSSVKSTVKPPGSVLIRDLECLWELDDDGRNSEYSFKYNIGPLGPGRSYVLKFLVYWLEKLFGKS